MKQRGHPSSSTQGSPLKRWPVASQAYPSSQSAGLSQGWPQIVVNGLSHGQGMGTSMHRSPRAHSKSETQVNLPEPTSPHRFC